MNLRNVAVAVTLAALLSVLIAWLWGGSPLARLSFAEGTVQRDVRGAEQQWQTGQVGDSLALGDGVRTGERSRARLVLSRGSVLQVDADTTLRLLSSAPGQEGIRIERGSAQIEAGEAELSIETQAGTVRVPRKGRLVVRESKQSTWVRVDMGRAELGWNKQRPLLAGEEHSTAHAGEGLPAAAAVEPVGVAPMAAVERSPSASDAASLGVSALVRGRDVRVQRTGESELSAIAPGAHRLEIGTRVAVDAESSLELEQGQGGSLVATGPTELVVGDGEAVATRVVHGKLRASAGRVPVELEVPGGRIVLMVDESGAVGTADLRASRHDTEVSVASGSVALHAADGSQTLEAGAHGMLGANAGVAAVGAGSAASKPDADQVAAEAAEAPPTIDPDAPVLSDLALPLGLSPQVHDPNPPSAIAFAVGDKCAGGQALLELATRSGAYVTRALGTERLLAWFPAGSTAYRVRCQQPSGGVKTLATGRISVQRDLAERQVTRRAPELDVDLDGRKYTAVYQTLLPRVNVHLPAAAGKVTLHVDSGGTSRDYPGVQGQLSFESGQLREGEHSLRIEGASARSKPTTLSIRFDNAAPAAYVEAPTGLMPGADGSYTLRGGALPGSTVSVDGVPLTLDKESRFETQLRLAPGARGFGLWIKHPRAGSHYYVRRVAAAGAP
jgi:hypothetical protein